MLILDIHLQGLRLRLVGVTGLLTRLFQLVSVRSNILFRILDRIKLENSAFLIGCGCPLIYYLSIRSNLCQLELERFVQRPSADDLLSYKRQISIRFILIVIDNRLLVFQILGPFRITCSYLKISIMALLISYLYLYFRRILLIRCISGLTVLMNVIGIGLTYILFAILQLIGCKREITILIGRCCRNLMSIRLRTVRQVEGKVSILFLDCLSVDRLMPIQLDRSS